MSISYAENLKVLLAGGEPEWIPFTFDIGSVPGFTEPVMRKFVEKTGQQDPAEYFDYDFRCFSLPRRFTGEDPAKKYKDVPPDVIFDEWGMGHWTGGKEGAYEKSYPPLASATSVAEVEALPTPEVVTDTDISAIAKFKKRGYPVFGFAGSVYEWSWWIRGMQNFMMDLAADQKMAQAIVNKVAGFTKEIALASAQAGIDVLCFYEDAGSQQALQIAPETWRKFIKTALQDIIEAVRSNYPDVKFFCHSCGQITEIVKDFVELGFDILHPIQPECMDVAAVKAEFGKDIVVCATLSAQQIFAFGTPDDIRKEVRRLKDICGSDNRCILCPSNLIQPETPWENIVAFAEEARARQNTPFAV